MSAYTPLRQIAQLILPHHLIASLGDLVIV